MMLTRSSSLYREVPLVQPLDLVGFERKRRSVLELLRVLEGDQQGLRAGWHQLCERLRISKRATGRQRNERRTVIRGRDVSQQFRRQVERIAFQDLERVCDMTLERAVLFDAGWLALFTEEFLDGDRAQFRADDAVSLAPPARSCRASCRTAAHRRARPVLPRAKTTSVPETGAGSTGESRSGACASDRARNHDA